MKKAFQFFVLKRRLAVAGAFSLFLLNAGLNACYGQELITAGPKLGLNLTTLTGKDAANASITPRYLAGAFLFIKPSSRFGLQLELNYTQKGARMRNGILTTSKVGLTYLELPVLAKFCYANSTRTTPYLATGPSTNFLINARNTSLENPDVTGQYKRLDLGWSFGAGLEMDAKNKWWVLDFRYTPGLVNLSNQANPPAIRTAVFTVSTAFGFELYDRFGNRRQ